MHRATAVRTVQDWFVAVATLGFLIQTWRQSLASVQVVVATGRTGVVVDLASKPKHVLGIRAVAHAFGHYHVSLADLIKVFANDAILNQRSPGSSADPAEVRVVADVAYRVVVL